MVTVVARQREVGHHLTLHHKAWQPGVEADQSYLGELSAAIYWRKHPLRKEKPILNVKADLLLIRTITVKGDEWRNGQIGLSYLAAIFATFTWPVYFEVSTSSSHRWVYLPTLHIWTGRIHWYEGFFPVVSIARSDKQSEVTSRSKSYERSNKQIQ